MSFFDIDRSIDYLTPEWIADRVEEINASFVDLTMRASLERYLYRVVLEQIVNKQIENPFLCAQIVLKL